MRVRHLSLAVLLFAALLFTAPLAAQDIEVSTTSQAFLLGDAQKIHLELVVGSLTVQGTDSGTVETELKLLCSRSDLEKCRRRAHRVHVAPRIDKNVFELRLKNTPRGKATGISAELLVRVPHGVPVEIDARGGDVSVSDLRSDLEIDGVAGTINVHFTQRLVRNVKIDVGAGRADLWVDDAHIEGSGFPRGVNWTGSGDYDIEIDLGAGDVDVTLVR
jgi:hypothetical protein